MFERVLQVLRSTAALAKRTRDERRKAPRATRGKNVGFMKVVSMIKAMTRSDRSQEHGDEVRQERALLHTRSSTLLHVLFVKLLLSVTRFFGVLQVNPPPAIGGSIP